MNICIYLLSAVSSIVVYGNNISQHIIVNTNMMQEEHQYWIAYNKLYLPQNVYDFLVKQVLDKGKKILYARKFGERFEDKTVNKIDNSATLFNLKPRISDYYNIKWQAEQVIRDCK